MLSINISGLYISWCRLQTRYKTQNTITVRQNSEITDRQTFLIFVRNVLIYGPFGSRTFFFQKLKKQWVHRVTWKEIQKFWYQFLSPGTKGTNYSEHWNQKSACQRDVHNFNDYIFYIDSPIWTSPCAIHKMIHIINKCL